MTRIRAVAIAFATLLLWSPIAAADDHATINAMPKVLGDPDAPVTIVEFASTSCPHCANFHANRLPWLKEAFIETGRAKLEYRDFPLNAPALWGAMLAHCAGPDRYFAYLDLIFKRQPDWAFTDEPQAELKDVAKQAGMSGADFDACMANESLQNAVIEARKDGIENYDIQSTPTFLIDGEYLRGVPTEEDFAKSIEAAGG
jgi:protein-disulfide isomerase